MQTALTALLESKLLCVARNGGLRFARPLCRRPNIDTALGECVVFAWQVLRCSQARIEYIWAHGVW